MNVADLIRVPQPKLLAELLGAAYRYECRTNQIFQLGSLRPLSDPEILEGLKAVLLVDDARLTVRHFPRSAVVVQWTGWADSMAREFTASGATELVALYDLLLIVSSARQGVQVRL